MNKDIKILEIMAAFQIRVNYLMTKVKTYYQDENKELYKDDFKDDFKQISSYVEEIESFLKD